MAIPAVGSQPRWVMEKRIFGTGQHISRAICEKYGFDPDREVSALAQLSEKEYRENLLQHNIEVCVPETSSDD